MSWILPLRCFALRLVTTQIKVDAGVVEHLVGQATMASSQSFSMIQRRISLSPEPAPPVKSGEPLKTMAMREPASVLRRRLELGDHVLEEQQRAVVDARQPAPKRPSKPCVSCSSLDLLLCFHSTPKGGLASK